MGSSPPGISRGSEQSPALHPSLGQGGWFNPSVKHRSTPQPSHHPGPPGRDGLTDRPSQPPPHGSWEPGQQKERKSYWSDRTKQTPGFLPSRAGLNPHQAEAGLCWFYWESRAGRGTKLGRGLLTPPPYLFLLGKLLVFLGQDLGEIQVAHFGVKLGVFGPLLHEEAEIGSQGLLGEVGVFLGRQQSSRH